MNKIRLLSLIFSATIAASLGAQAGSVMQFKYSKDDSYRILSSISEDVKINGLLHHHAEIVNRISVHVVDTDADGRGLNEATFMTSEQSTTGNAARFTWGEEYESRFWRDKRGHYDISDAYFMPVVRDVPLFPTEPIAPGATWSADGHEAHDLRRSFDLRTPYKVPFTATYPLVTYHLAYWPDVRIDAPSRR